MTGADPRYTAYDMLNELDSGKSTLDFLISEKFDPIFAQMSRRDRNLTYALVYGVLRTRGTADWIISRFLSQKIEKTDPRVLNILRIALFQIFHMTRIPQSAAVNTAVEISKESFSPYVVKFVNGVLRNIIRGKESITWPDKNANPLLWLSVTCAFPEWMLKRWVKRYGFEETEKLCEFFNTAPPLSIRTNTLRLTRDQLATEILPFADTVTPVSYTPEGLLIHGLKCTVTELDAFHKGFFQVQDEAAQLVSHVLDPQPGETVMDACAGLGGKTGHMAQLMENRGLIVAIDNHAGRLGKLEVQMRRLGTDMVQVLNHNLHHDLTEALHPKHPLSYDRVLIDAPCSGTGVIRRNPDTKWFTQPKDFTRFGKNQLKYLETVSSLVKPGGTLVYAVCSIEPEETVDVISSFIKAHPEFIVKPITGIAGAIPGISEERGFIRSIPHVHQMDGFFIAALKKSA